MGNSINIRQLLHYIFRLAFGVAFLLSGFVKAIDPLGAAYKMVEYFHAAGIYNYNDAALPLATLLSLVEMWAGFIIIRGTKMRLGIVLGASFMLIFTPLTLWIALTNAVADCGCFGDAIKLGNWDTFWKNIGLSALLVLIQVTRPPKQWYSHQVKTSVLPELLFIAYTIALPIISYHFLPVFDFRPYAVGENLYENSIIPEEAPSPVYHSTFTYQKGDSIEDFTVDNLPSEADGWVFVSTKTKLIEEGYIPPIKDFMLTLSDGTDITEEITQATGKKLLIVSREIEDMDDQDLAALSHINTIIPDSLPVYFISASSFEQMEALKYQGMDWTFASVDETTAKTIIRTNPGMLLIESGTVLNKWPTFYMNRIGAIQITPQKTFVLWAKRLILMGLGLILLFIPKKKKSTYRTY